MQAKERPLPNLHPRQKERRDHVDFRSRIIFILISSPVGLRRSLRAAIDCSSLMPNARLFTKGNARHHHAR